jgi:vancomycin resistance protein VanJ
VAGLVRFAAWGYGSLVLAGLALRPWVGDDLFLARYTGYFMPWLLLGLVPGAAWACWTRRRALTTLLGGGVAVVLAVHAPLVRSPGPPQPPPGVRLLVMSYNTWSENHDARRIAEVVLRHAPDILLLQEIRPEVFARLVDRLGDADRRAPLHRAYDAALQQGVVSRYPIESVASMEEKGKAQKAVLRVADRPVVVLNVHPLRTGGWHRRYGQISALLREDVVREQAPVILGGDLNAPDHSQLYGLVAKILDNAHREAGHGFGFTYPSRDLRVLGRLGVPPLVRIDHVFFSRHFVALRAATVDDPGGSDHHPVLAELVLTRAAREAPREDVRAAAAAAPTSGEANGWPAP